VWQRYTTFWLTSLLSRILFFVVPVVVALIPLIGFAARFYRWLHVRRINSLHRALASIERAHSSDQSRLAEYQIRITEIESAAQSLKVPRQFELDLQQLRLHLRMVQEDFTRMQEAK